MLAKLAKLAMLAKLAKRFKAKLPLDKTGTCPKPHLPQTSEGRRSYFGAASFEKVINSARTCDCN